MKGCHEIIALVAPTAATFGADWPLAPGQVRRTAANDYELLHFAPGRWLAPALSHSLHERCERLIASGAAVLIDVDGKWHGVVVPRIAGTSVLAQSLDVELALGARECAATTLFDSPAILARTESHYHLWVQASYRSAWQRFEPLVSGARPDLVIEDLEKS